MFNALRTLNSSKKNPSIEEASIEGLLGNLFKSKTTRQKERIAQAIEKIDEEKKNFEKYTKTEFESANENLNQYKTLIIKIQASIKNKKFNQKLFNEMTLEEDEVKFEFIQQDMIVHKNVVSYLNELFHSNDPDTIIEKFGKDHHYIRFDGDDENNIYAEHGDKVSSSYPSSFISYATNMISEETKAVDEVFSMSKNVIPFIDKQKLLIKEDTSSEDIMKIVHRCHEVAITVSYFQSNVANCSKLHEVAHMAARIAKECYE